MNIHTIKTILENKIKTLNDQKNIAFQGGDLEQYAQLEAEINETQNTLNQL